MVKLSSCALLVAFVVGASAFVAPQAGVAKASSALQSAKGYWDPLGLYELGSGEAFDTFPGMFPSKDFLDAGEAKNGRMAMLGWTGVWATSQDTLGLHLHWPGFPVEPDWTKAFAVFAAEQPIWFGVILALVGIAEGEGAGHSRKKDPTDYNFDYLGIKKKISPEKYARYKDVETKNGRAAMIAMASLFAFKAIPGSVPVMDLLGAS